jgi:hypothetical protein
LASDLHPPTTGATDFILFGGSLVVVWHPAPTFQGAPKKKKSDVPTYLPFLSLFEILRSDFRKYFYGVFGLLMQRNGRNRD